ncbi:MAG: N-6 DNA methylase [Candidatus Moeniiplasma glomeromycotorum]|nr:N-6 DNA methylase [Candidatus Moeniiplasma glomeromycotorum]MCE8168168.1 N-6 DNA methylase [Candidatus Moeniiplasma glomeromycotorum]MCE8170013.1 N-6 DNA methylase [Candidatus Moeniiplasma glomeromycotorum]
MKEIIINTANHLTYQAKINNGSFYTPSQLVNHVWEFIVPFLTKNIVILDTSAGKGSFFLNRENQNLLLIAGDNDQLAVNYLKENFPFLQIIQKKCFN